MLERRIKMGYLSIPLGILGLILMISSVSTPWYHITLRDGPDSNNTIRTYESRFYFIGSITNNPEAGNHNFQIWANMPERDFTGQLFFIFQMLDIIGILLVVIFTVGMIVAIKKGRREIAASIGLAVAIFCLFVPLFFMQQFPIATNADNRSGSDLLPFWYSQDSPNFEIGAPGNVHHRVTAWSPDTGWYLPIVSAFLCLFAATLISIERPLPSWRKYVKPVVVTLIMVLILIALSITLYPQPHPSQPTDSESMGLRVEKTDENWTINITGGVSYLSGLHMQVTDPYTGETILDAILSVGETADYKINNNDRSSEGDWPRLDTGDSIILKSSGGHVQSAYIIHFVRNQNIVGSSIALP